MNHTIKVTLTTKSRLHIADAAAKQGKIGNTKYSLTSKVGMPIETVVDDHLELRRQLFPVINANLLRGRLRRLIADRLMKSFAERGEEISIDLVHLLTSLSSSASPSSAKTLRNAMLHKDPVKAFNGTALDSGDKSVDKDGNPECQATSFKVEDIERQIADPFVALFGGGPNLWRSRLVVPDLFPHTEELNKPCFTNGDIAGDFEGMVNIPSYQLTEVVSIIKHDDAYDHVDKVPAKELDAWIRIDSANSSRADDEKKRNITNMLAAEAVIPGIPFIGEIEIKQNGATDEVFKVMQGLIKLALNDLDNSNIGSKARDNWGRVDIKSSDTCVKAAEQYIDGATPSEIMRGFGVSFR